MVNDCTKGFSTLCPSFRPKIVDRIKIWNVYTTLIGISAFRAKFLDIHSKNAYIYFFDFLKQKYNLKSTKGTSIKSSETYESRHQDTFSSEETISVFIYSLINHWTYSWSIREFSRVILLRDDVQKLFIHFQLLVDR